MNAFVGIVGIIIVIAGIIFWGIKIAENSMFDKQL